MICNGQLAVFKGGAEVPGWDGPEVVQIMNSEEHNGHGRRVTGHHWQAAADSEGLRSDRLVKARPGRLPAECSRVLS